MCWRDRIMCVSKKPVDCRGGWAGAFNWFSLFPFRPRCCFMFTSFNFYFLLSSCFGDALFCLPDSSCSLFIMLCCVMISYLFLPFMLYLLTHHPYNGSLPPVRNHWALKQTYISTPFFSPTRHETTQQFSCMMYIYVWALFTLYDEMNNR